MKKTIDNYPIKNYINAMDYSTYPTKMLTAEDNPRRAFRRAIDNVYKASVSNPEKLKEATEALDKICK